MKNRVAILCLVFFVPLTIYGQNNLTADIVVDSLSGDKGELFSKTKMFITEHWNSAQDVIQNDDREAGVIVVKGLSSVTVRENNNFVALTHSFKHTAKFYHKDNRCRMVFSIEPSSSVRAVPFGNWKEISNINEPFKGAFATGLSKKGYVEIQQTLAANIRNMAQSYKTYMKAETVLDEDW